MYILFVICGYLSTVFALITQIPQVVTIIKHRSGKNLSYPYLALIMVDCIMVDCIILDSVMLDARNLEVLVIPDKPEGRIEVYLVYGCNAITNLVPISLVK